MNNFFKKRKNTMSPSKNGNIEFILSIENSVPHAEAKEPFLVVKRAIDVIPEWYKDLSPLVDINGKPDLSLKKCIPFLDAINTGYFLVTAKDYTFRSDKEKEEYFFSGSIEQSQHKDYPVLKHPIEQVGDMPFGQEFIKYAFKWNNQYIIKTPPGYSILFTSPLNYSNLPFYTLSGVVDTDKFFMSVLFPFFMKNNFEGVIPAGTPVVQIIPFKREEWSHTVNNDPPTKMKHNLAEDFNKYMSDRWIDGNPIPVGGIYKKFYRVIKKYL